jgi:hypothetical protein
VSAPRKTASAFFPAQVIARARHNAQTSRWAAQARDAIVAAAQPWVKRSDDELWELMFGNSIKRAWQVLSNGHCPACKKPVPMYEWIPAALAQPWKMRCPRCGVLFPKNDFGKYYRSGLNEQRVFEPSRADRSLLFHVEHPSPADPLHRFGVDDGEGYVEGQRRWRFIGAYLIFGQWKQAIVGGIHHLAEAYVVTGESIYAHKAGVLLDRVADLYPTFDFGKEGVMYEGRPHAGYVSTWHDACREAYDLVTAYDAVFEAMAQDRELVSFVSAKARKHRLANAKTSFAEIQKNIEDGILRDTLAHRYKIQSNYPTTEIAITAIETVLGWPGNRDEINAALDRIIVRATAVDGLSGEKGLAGYSTIAPHTIAELLGRYARLEPGFLAAVVKRNPRLHAMYRFHLDTWCLGQYYPNCGDSGAFANKNEFYPGVDWSRHSGTGPSAFTFLEELARLTNDSDFVRLLYAANGNKEEGLPYDLFAEDPPGFQQRVARTIAAEGAGLQLASINKTEWCLAILRAGQGGQARAAWLDYDSGGGHGHADGMNLGLYARGLDLMPDFGYPPVQYGGWGAPRSVWYTQSAAHNTVVGDGHNTRPGKGRTTLWAEGQQFHAIRAAAPQLIGGSQYERSAVLVDLSPQDSYLLDVFRAVGGKEHIRFLHSHFGEIVTEGLSLQPVGEAGLGEQMRCFRKDAQPTPGWSVEWKIRDYLKYLPPGKDIRLRCTDLTPGSEVLTAEAWVSVPRYGGTADAWIPRVLVRRRAQQAPLASCFVSVIQPYEGRAPITSVRRLPLQSISGQACSEADVALEIRLANGDRDVLIALDGEGPTGPARPARGPVLQKEMGIRLDGQLALVQLASSGQPRRVVLCLGQLLEVGTLRLQRRSASGWTEADLEKTLAPIVSGAAADVERLQHGNRLLWPQGADKK